MAIKLILLKSGEDIISEISEMTVGEENKKVVGYFLTKPCVVKLRNSQILTENDGDIKESSFKVSLFPWMPLSADKVIPIPSDWLVTMVEPKEKLKEMYIEDVVNYEQNNQIASSDEQSDDNKSD